MIIGIVAMFIICVVLANAVLIINGWPSAIKTEKSGYCYYVDTSNLAYSEAVSKMIKRIKEEGEESGEEPELVTGTVVPTIKNDGSLTFYSNCGVSLYEPVKGTDIIWKLVSPYRKVCENITVREFEKYHTAMWYGCKIGSGCHYKYEMGDNYNVRFTSCCVGDGGQKGNSDKYCKANSITIFDPCAFGTARYRVRTNEFVINRQEGWQKCHYVDDGQGYRLLRNDVAVGSGIFIKGQEFNSEHNLYPLGWLTRNQGSEIIMLTQSNIAGSGLGGPYYWGNLTDEEWMKNHFNLGNIEYGWEDPAGSLPAFYTLNTQPPFKTKCEMVFTTTDKITNFAEFKSYCKNVWTRMNEYGNVVITTSSTEMCVVNVKGTILGEEVNTSVTIDNLSPAVFRLEKPMYLQCDMTSKNGSTAGPCGLNKKWNEFSPDYYTTDVIKDHSNYEGKPGEISKDKKPSMWSKVKNIVGIILIVIGVIVVAVIIFIVVVKILAKTPYCNEKHPSFVKFSNALCNKKYQQQQQQPETNITIVLDDIKVDDKDNEKLTKKKNRKKGKKLMILFIKILFRYI